MWIGLKNLTPADQNIDADLTLYIGPSVSDAWRFDDVGCQTGSRMALNNLPNSKSCPAMRGSSPLTFTDYEYDPVTQRVTFRLAVSYDPFTPATGVTYVLWNLVFDHTHSAAGSDADPSTCDNAGLPLTITMSDASDPNYPPFLITPQNVFEYIHFADPSDQIVTWNGSQPVATKASTWGRIKGTYR
jgi:hypothetical protein